MNNIIVFEGADRVGKTSIAKAVTQELGYNYLHFGAPDYYRPFGYQYTDIPRNDNYVLDRSWISGIFYDCYRHHHMDYRMWKLSLGLFYTMHQRFNIQYFHVQRPWLECESDHRAEIKAGLQNVTGNTKRVLSLEERYNEHILWYNFYHKRNPFDFLNDIRVTPLSSTGSLQQAASDALVAIKGDL